MRKSFFITDGLLLAATSVMEESAPVQAGLVSAYSGEGMAVSQTRAVAAAAKTFPATFGASGREAIQFSFAAEKHGTLARFRRSGPGISRFTLQ
ncbi:hypothetical protein [Acetobacter oeni]|uniref:Uncharacterized protein n=1 Tax=Acetobacter oeni TaxID=304077 RepID=A0A511XJB2_9PROT|nr:hypothetical protein [Acetobacter oeni]MBB3882796.1 hypothetical protein [Acetobacter oeni]NHO18887.1 hypothetical protein [Acetobacter oeni]GBR09551.1 hypothetical protein AA21952_2874 [Acetobacter oeni LMG 21952]GEN63018.1 hypothetical protein AOE01nite_12420 [Acetobacter oeni]